KRILPVHSRISPLKKSRTITFLNWRTWQKHIRRVSLGGPGPNYPEGFDFDQKLSVAIKASSNPFLFIICPGTCNGDKTLPRMQCAGEHQGESLSAMRCPRSNSGHRAKWGPI